jgi:hypothetical protein
MKMRVLQHAIHQRAVPIPGGNRADKTPRVMAPPSRENTKSDEAAPDASKRHEGQGIYFVRRGGDDAVG